jgi:uncharacterized membrane protein
MMVGGYLSFRASTDRRAITNTPIEKLLHARACLTMTGRKRPRAAWCPSWKPATVIAGLPAAWPPLLGYNEVVLHPDATLVATVGGQPSADRRAGHGQCPLAGMDQRHVPHWMPDDYLAWPDTKRSGSTASTG